MRVFPPPIPLMRIAAGIVLVVTALAALSAAPAAADIPAPPSASFTAPHCPGTTFDDPTNSSGPITNLMVIDGLRLDTFNAGEPVVLHDSWGGADSNAYPALCVTRYVTGVGAVSDWTFCTDADLKVCGQIGASGELMEAGVPVGQQRQVPTNSGLDDRQRAAVATLLSGPPHPYGGTGSYGYGVTEARADGTSFERDALQALVWCITNVDNMNSTPDGTALCAASMDPAAIDALAAQAKPTPTLSISAEPTTGTQMSFVITTNIHGKAMTLTLPTGTSLTVCGGNATLTGNTLTVTGPGTTATTVRLCGSPLTTPAELRALATNVDSSALYWSRSDHATIECQVYANAAFNRYATVTASAVASAAPAAPVTTTTTTTTVVAPTTPVAQADTALQHRELAFTGSTNAALTALASVLIALGSCMVAARRRLDV